MRTSKEPHGAKSTTLLHVLPATTAAGGAIAMLAVPAIPVVVGSVATLDLGTLKLLALGLPIMSVLAVAVGILGLAMGAIAGLPDHLLRRRPDRRLWASVLAVLILPALVTTTWWVARMAWWPTMPAEITVWSAAAVAGATVLATTVVVVLHRHQPRRKPVARTFGRF